MIYFTTWQTAYRELFHHKLEPDLIDEIRCVTNRNFVLGSRRFGEEIAALLERWVMSERFGRPRKVIEPESGGISD